MNMLPNYLSSYCLLADSQQSTYMHLAEVELVQNKYITLYGVNNKQIVYT